jgi:hypothetical protein
VPDSPLTSNRATATAALFAAAVISTAALQRQEPAPAVPQDAIAAIVEAFGTHSVVALGEGPHGNEQGHAFRLALVRDPRFAAAVDDILVEFGSARYQRTIDRFMDGESVADGELRRVWQDTTAAGPVWDRPIYEEFFRAVRALNLARGPELRLRVLLGDAPIEWERVRTRDDLRTWGMAKDAHAGAVIKREVLGKGRRVLVIFGDGHLQGRGFPPASLTNVLERPPAATRIFAISSSFADLAAMQPDVAAWPVPSVARIRGTVIGARPYGLFYPPPPARGWDKVRLEDQFDAVLYLGPGRPTSSPFPPALCADEAYMKMRLERMRLDDERVSGPNVEWLERYCAAQAPPPGSRTGSLRRHLR